MGEPTEKQDVDPATQPRSPERSENAPKTWWGSHGAVVILVSAAVLFVLLIVLNTK